MNLTPESVKPLVPDEIEALQIFANTYGKRWKEILLRPNSRLIDAKLTKIALRPDAKELIATCGISSQIRLRGENLPPIGLYYGPFISAAFYPLGTPLSPIAC